MEKKKIGCGRAVCRSRRTVADGEPGTAGISGEGAALPEKCDGLSGNAAGALVGHMGTLCKAGDRG